MSASTLTTFLDWIAAHSYWANLAVFLIAFSESLLIVGLFVPGALLMFGIGALVASGRMDLSATLSWAIAGAIAGDGISFWFGYHYKTRLRDIWPFSRYPRLFQQGEEFFARHGGKSIIFGRFVGPVRPIIPAVAGMMGLPPYRFLMINVMSGVAWAPAYILPGVAFGASLELASKVATRLATLIVLTGAILWFIQWLVRRVYRFIHPRANTFFAAAMVWSRRHRFAGKIVAAVIDPEKPEVRGLFLLAGILVLSASVFLMLINNLGGIALVRLDTSTWHLMQTLRTPWADQGLITFFELGGTVALTSITVAVFLWLTWRRYWLAVSHWLAAIGFAIGSSALLTAAYMHAPAADMATINMPGFPNSNTVSSTTLYGFLAVMLAQNLAGYKQWLTYTLVSIIIALVAFAQVYFGAQKFTYVLGGVTLGLAWVAILGIAYRRHQRTPIQAGRLTLIVSITILCTISWQLVHQAARDLARLGVSPTPVIMSFEKWWQTGWQELPAYRIDLKGQLEQPLNVQWADHKQHITDYLTGRGWQKPPPLRLATILRWLSDEQRLATLPILPQVHDGKHEAVLLLYKTSASGKELVLRLWPSSTVLAAGTADRPHRKNTIPLWLGYVAYFGIDYPLPFLALPHLQKNFNGPLNELDRVLGTGNGWQVRHRKLVLGRHPGLRYDWNGNILVIAPAAKEPRVK